MQKISKYKHCFIRENSYDKQIVGEVLRTYQWMQPKNEVVLDIGACFGAYSVLAQNQGAKEVHCYEPEVNNFQMVLKNVNEYENIYPNNSALVNDDRKEISFYLTNGINNGTYSTTAFRGRREIKVNASNFDEVLHRVKPSTIKMDCEGSEYNLLDKPLPDFVKKITIEIHFTRKEWRNLLGPRLISLFKDWNVKTKPKIGEQNWHTIGAWYR